MNDPICQDGAGVYSEEELIALGCKTESLNPGKTIVNVINVVLTLVGIVAVIFVIVGAAQYIAAQGDPGKMKKARDTILYAVLGLILALLAFSIVNFVLGSVFGG